MSGKNGSEKSGKVEKFVRGSLKLRDRLNIAISPDELFPYDGDRVKMFIMYHSFVTKSKQTNQELIMLILLPSFLVHLVLGSDFRSFSSILFRSSFESIKIKYQISQIKDQILYQIRVTEVTESN